MRGTLQMPLIDLPATHSAVLDGDYRYELWRKWSYGEPWVNFIMLNPSTADAKADDPTIRKCVGFAKKWGYKGLVVTNLFAYRATDPKCLKRCLEPVGKLNDFHIRAVAERSQLHIAAWGAFHEQVDKGRRARDVLAMLEGIAPVMCLRRTPKGHPEHPLYLPYTLEPDRFRVEHASSSADGDALS